MPRWSHHVLHASHLLSLPHASRSWMLPRHPSMMRLATCSAEPLHHAKRCSNQHTIIIMHYWPSTKDHLPQQLQAFWHFWEELSIAASILLKFTWAVVPSSLRHPCWPRFIIHIRVPNTAFISQEMPSSGTACLKTLKNSATHAQLVPNTESTLPPSWCYIVSHPTPTLPW